MTSINQGKSRRNELHQTPIKKAKDMIISEPKTAQSQQKTINSLDDIDPQELFEQFDHYIKITEDPSNNEEDEDNVCKKLDYQELTPKGKLTFTPTFTGSSMKKKKLVYLKQNQPKFESIVLFEVTSEEKAPQVKPQSVEATKCETPKARSKESKVLKCWAAQKKVAKE